MLKIYVEFMYKNSRVRCRISTILKLLRTWQGFFFNIFVKFISNFYEQLQWTSPPTRWGGLLDILWSRGGWRHTTSQARDEPAKHPGTPHPSGQCTFSSQPAPLSFSENQVHLMLGHHWPVSRTVKHTLQCLGGIHYPIEFGLPSHIPSGWETHSHLSHPRWHLLGVKATWECSLNWMVNST